MKAFLAHLKKEIRDQRSILIAVFLALPVLTLLAFWGFAGHLVEADVRDAAPLIVPIAMVLFLLAAVSDLFAGEVRRGTIDFLRRQPGGMHHAFRAKALLMIVGLAAVFFWQVLVLQGAWLMWGRTFQPSFAEVVEEAFLSPYAIGATLLAAWILLSSTWLKQGGVAILLAPMLAAALALPGYLWVEAHPMLAGYAFRVTKDILPWLLGAIVLLPLVAAAWSWLGGRRVIRSSWSAAWRGLALVLLLSGVAYGSTAVWLDVQTKLTPDSDDLAIVGGHVSPNGRMLYLTVEGDGHANLYDHRAWRRTPRRLWVVDLETNAWRTHGDWGELVGGPPLKGLHLYGGWDASSLTPLPKLVQYRPTSDGESALAVWIDANQGEVLKVVPNDVRTKDVMGWIDEIGLATSWVRDDEGRRIWLPTGVESMHRATDAGEVTRGPLPLVFGTQRAIPGGWQGWHAKHRKRALFDAATGEIHLSDFEPHRHVISPRRVLVSTWIRGTKRWEHRLLDPATKEQQPAKGGPEGAVGFLCAVDETSVLCVPGREGKPLTVWDPVAGTMTQLTDASDEIWIHGRDRDGRLAFVVRHGDTWDVHVLDPETKTLSTPARSRGGRPRLFALMPDGTTYGIEDCRRVYRYGPETDDVELLFPR